MSIGNVNFEEITEADLAQLKENKVAEGILIEYKRDLYSRSDNDKRETLKDTTSFANSAGGHIVIGMAAADGVPTDLVGIEGTPDTELQRLENLCRDCIEPRIVGLRMRPVHLASGRYALVIRIPRSWNPPHARLFGGARQYYARNSSGVHEASVEELRAMFTAGATLLDRARAFVRGRITAIHSNDAPVLMGDEGKMVLHVIPFSAFGSESGLDPARILGKPLVPIWLRDFRPMYNLDGLLAVGIDDEPKGYVQVFRNSIIESAAGSVCQRTPRGLLLYAEDVEDQVITKLTDYLDALSKAEILPPITVFLTGVRMTGTIVVPTSSTPIIVGVLPHRHNEMFFPAITIDEYGRLEDYRAKLRPMFDALWNAAGFERSLSYGAAGEWRRR
jgi:hypothetical protein